MASELTASKTGSSWLLRVCAVAIAAILATLHLVPSGGDGTLQVLAILGASSSIYGLAAFLLLRRGARLSGASIIALSALMHVGLVSTSPHLDDDLYRYTWDGKVLVAGENPYAHPPNSLELIHLWRRDQYRIPYDHVSTIYPPGTQLIFSVVTRLAPDSFTAMKVAFSLINLGVIALVLVLLRHLGRPSAQLLLYAWNPLIIKEVADSGHMDPWMMLWVLLTLLLLMRGAWLAAVFAWSAAILAKLVPLSLAWLLWFRLGSRRALLIATPALLALAYAPFLEPGAAPLGGLSTYGEYWLFNPGLFELISAAVSLALGATEVLVQGQIARAIAGAVVFMIAYLAARRITPASPSAHLSRAALITFAALLLLSPTVDPWYLIWIAPLVALHPTLPGVLFTLAPALSYGYYLNESDPILMRVVEYTLIYGALGVWLMRRRSTGEAQL